MVVLRTMEKTYFGSRDLALTRSFFCLVALAIGGTGTGFFFLPRRPVGSSGLEVSGAVGAGAVGDGGRAEVVGASSGCDPGAMSELLGRVATVVWRRISAYRSLQYDMLTCCFCSIGCRNHFVCDGCKLPTEISVES